MLCNKISGDVLNLTPLSSTGRAVRWSAWAVPCSPCLRGFVDKLVLGNCRRGLMTMPAVSSVRLLKSGATPMSNPHRSSRRGVVNASGGTCAWLGLDWQQVYRSTGQRGTKTLCALVQVVPPGSAVMTLCLVLDVRNGRSTFLADRVQAKWQTSTSAMAGLRGPVLPMCLRYKQAEGTV